MAERRMIHKKASVSTDLDDLRRKHGADALAFYLLMVPHFDRWGCVPRDPVKLRAMVIPMWEATLPADVKRWCDWMVRRGMLEAVKAADGDRGLRAPDFHEHQRGTEFQKESPSPYEPPEVTERWTRGARKPARKEVADLQGGRRPVADQSSTRSVRREGKVKPSPSPSPSPGPAAEPAEGSPSAPSGGAEAPRRGRGTSDDMASAAEASPTLRAALEKTRAKGAANGR